MNSFLKLIYEVLIIAFGIFYISVIRLENQVAQNLIKIPFLDKIVHFIMYLVLSAAILRAYYRAKKYLTRHLIFTVLFTVAYGGTIELIQHYYVVGREGDFLDLLANTVGAICGLFICNKYKQKSAIYKTPN